jgi:hypothetical protein
MHMAVGFVNFLRFIERIIFLKLRVFIFYSLPEFWLS